MTLLIEFNIIYPKRTIIFNIILQQTFQKVRVLENMCEMDRDYERIKWEFAASIDGFSICLWFLSSISFYRIRLCVNGYYYLNREKRASNIKSM